MSAAPGLRGPACLKRRLSGQPGCLCARLRDSVATGMGRQAARRSRRRGSLSLARLKRDADHAPSPWTTLAKLPNPAPCHTARDRSAQRAASPGGMAPPKRCEPLVLAQWSCCTLKRCGLQAHQLRRSRDCAVPLCRSHQPKIFDMAPICPWLAAKNWESNDPTGYSEVGFAARHNCLLKCRMPMASVKLGADPNSTGWKPNKGRKVQSVSFSSRATHGR